MYIAKYLRKISTFQLNFKYYKRILKASTLYKDRAKLKNSIIGLLLQALSWGKDMVAMHVRQLPRIYADHHYYAIRA